jgi:hypothetical protein
MKVLDSVDNWVINQLVKCSFEKEIGVQSVS